MELGIGRSWLLVGVGVVRFLMGRGLRSDFLDKIEALSRKDILRLECIEIHSVLVCTFSQFPRSKIYTLSKKLAENTANTSLPTCPI